MLHIWLPAKSNLSGLQLIMCLLVFVLSLTRNTSTLPLGSTHRPIRKIYRSVLSTDAFSKRTSRVPCKPPSWCSLFDIIMSRQVFNRRCLNYMRTRHLQRFLKESTFCSNLDAKLHRSDVRVVLECDGTDVEDEATFSCLLRDTVFLLLTPGEAWVPPSVEAIKTAINAIPQIVCDAMQSLELVNTAPSWKIMEHKGKVTVVLTWEPQDRRSRTPEVKIEVLPDGVVLPGRGLASGQSGSRPSTASSGRNKSPQPPGLQILPGPLGVGGNGGSGREPTDRAEPPLLATLPVPGQPLTADRHDREPRRDKKKHGDTKHDKHNHAECDFHCSSLHQQQNKAAASAAAAATSPIVDFPEMAFGPPGVFGHGGGGMPLPQSKSVHFEAAHVGAAETRATTAVTADNEPESESQQEDDEELADRYLLLVDQLSVDQDKHLTVKDIGAILERLSSKVVDVERLEREKESNDIHNWTIKATLRGGHVLSEVGVVYNDRYYGIMEHPGYF